MIDASADAATYRQAAQENRQDPLRDGSTLVLPHYGQVVMTGDLHGHARNLERIRTFCNLEHSGARHVILHEIIHEDLGFSAAPDLSHRVLLQAARWKCEFPDQVHFLQSNHELAQLLGQEISKGGRIVTVDFAYGVEQTYGQAGGRAVMEAILDFLGSFPLAARTANRVFLSHSLPGLRELATFDPAVLTREPSEVDFLEGGSAYSLVWGRRQTPEVLEHLARVLDADLFVCGHQPQETGYEVVGQRMLIIASDHNHGVFVPIDLSRRLTMDELVRAVRPLASIA